MAKSLQHVVRRLQALPASVFWSIPGAVLYESHPERQPRGLLSGSFDPLHEGHTGLRAAAEQQLDAAVFYELSVCNVDKRTLDEITIRQRCRQFQNHPLALSNAPTFLEKSRLFPVTTFVVGTDTAQRIVQPRYYASQTVGLRNALAEIRDLGCDLLVAGRLCDDRFVSLSDIAIPQGFEQLFSELPTDSFRKDISSTELRHSNHRRPRE